MARRGNCVNPSLPERLVHPLSLGFRKILFRGNSPDIETWLSKINHSPNPSPPSYSQRRKNAQPISEGGNGPDQRQDEEYFLAGRSTPWWIVAASLFASNIGAEHFAGQAGTAAAVGISTGLFEWTAAYFIIALGWAYSPVFLKARLTTVPEYLERRFSRHCRAMVVVVTLASYCMAKIASSLYAGSVLLEVLMGVGTW